MLGIQDPWIITVFILCILSALLCLVWGVVKWNQDDPEIDSEVIRHWVEEEERVEDEL